MHVIYLILSPRANARGLACARACGTDEYCVWMLSQVTCQRIKFHIRYGVLSAYAELIDCVATLSGYVCILMSTHNVFP